MTVLAADALTVTAADGSSLIADVSLTVEPGETVLVCGNPGSGKTLLTKGLKGLLTDRADLSVSGTVRRNGSIGYVLQSPRRQLVRRTVERDAAFGLENKGYPRETIVDRVREYADLLGVTHLLDRNVRSLSRGEVTKVALLGVLVTEPDAVILDEPLSVLDHPNTTIVLDAIDRLRATETAVMIAEHDVRDLLTRGDRVVLLRAGRIVSSGPPRAVVSDLYESGVKLPFNTEVSLALGDGHVPLSMDDSEVELH